MPKKETLKLIDYGPSLYSNDDRHWYRIKKESERKKNVEKSELVEDEQKISLSFSGYPYVHLCVRARCVALSEVSWNENSDADKCDDGDGDGDVEDDNDINNENYVFSVHSLSISFFFLFSCKRANDCARFFPGSRTRPFLYYACIYGWECVQICLTI